MALAMAPGRGADAHPPHPSLGGAHRFAPRWTFDAVLIGPDRRVLGAWRSTTRPGSRAVPRAVEAAPRG